MKFGLSLPPRLPIDKTVEIAVKADKSIFESVWYGELFYNYSAIVMLSAIATKTDNVKLGLFTNPFHINPAVTASIGCSLNELSSSRFILGLGGGDIPTLHTIGISPSKMLASIKESAFIIRALAKGESISYSGKIYHTEKAQFRYKSLSFPILIGGQGSGMMRLSLKVGEGFLLNSSSLHDVRFFQELKKKHKHSSAEIIPYVLFEISAVPSKLLLMVIARVVAGAAPQALKRLNIDSALASNIKNLIFNGKVTEAANLITPDILKEFAIVGSVEQCITRVEEFKKLGVKKMILAGTLDPHNFNSGLEIVINQLLPSFPDIS
ncbi:MAG: LLM class flavin-dependent oxidoreductase [Candidatus Hodarchaeota archaeon]